LRLHVGDWWVLLIIKTLEVSLDRLDFGWVALKESLNPASFAVREQDHRSPVSRRVIHQLNILLDLLNSEFETRLDTAESIVVESVVNGLTKFDNGLRGVSISSWGWLAVAKSWQFNFEVSEVPGYPGNSS